MTKFFRGHGTPLSKKISPKDQRKFNRNAEKENSTRDDTLNKARETAEEVFAKETAQEAFAEETAQKAFTIEPAEDMFVKTYNPIYRALKKKT